MKKVIKPGRARKSINFIDNIVYSRQKDLEGKPTRGAAMPSMVRA